MESPQEYQELINSFKYFKDQHDMIQGQLEILNVSLGTIVNSKKTIENIKEGVNQDDEILVPIGGRVYVKASIKDIEKVLLVIPQDVIIEKDLDGAIEFIDKLIEQHNQQIQFIRTQLQNIDVNLQEISQKIQKGYT
jgi:prefoldin alpha subunit